MHAFQIVEPKQTKLISIHIGYDTKINRITMREYSFANFDILCRGKKVIPRSKWKPSSPDFAYYNYCLDIPERTMKRGDIIKLYVRNNSEMNATFEGSLSYVLANDIDNQKPFSYYPYIPLQISHLNIDDYSYSRKQYPITYIDKDVMKDILCEPKESAQTPQTTASTIAYVANSIRKTLTSFLK